MKPCSSKHILQCFSKVIHILFFSSVEFVVRSFLGPSLSNQGRLLRKTAALECGHRFFEIAMTTPLQLYQDGQKQNVALHQLKLDVFQLKKFKMWRNREFYGLQLFARNGQLKEIAQLPDETDLVRTDLL
jgi:hypothetical protein